MTDDFSRGTGHIWADGEFMPWEDATIHVLSHALHYSSSVFEGMRIYGGKIFSLTEHNERLLTSGHEIDMSIPFTVEALDRAAEDLVSSHGLQYGYVRPIAWRGSESMGVSATGTAVHVAIAAWPWPELFSVDAKSKGIALHTTRWRRPAPDTAPTRAKGAGQYAIGTIARVEAEAAGADDALFLDYRGYLAESTGANIFLAIDGQLHTPLPDCFLDGITRRAVIKLARGFGIEVVERHILPNELESADEVFLTGTAYEVQPVSRIDDTTFGPGQITECLVDAYSSLVRA